MLSRRFLHTSTLWISRHIRGSPYASNDIFHILKILPNVLRHTPFCQLHQSCIAHSASEDQIVSNLPSKSKLKSSQSSSSEPRKIFKMPNGLTKMLLTKNATDASSWPKFSTLCSLARKCGHAGVSTQEVEAYLLANYRGKAKGQVHREPNFYSLHLLTSWNKGHKVLEKTLNYFESILQNEKTQLPVKRLEYCMAIWRISIIVQDCFNKNLLEEIELLEKFSNEMRGKYKDTSLSLLLLLAGLNHNRENGVERDPLFYEISDILKKVTKESNKPQPHKMPPLLMCENPEEMLQKILERRHDVRYQIELQSYLCRAQWSNTSFSKSLETLGLATNNFIDVVGDDIEEGAKVGVALVEAWQTLAVSALELKMTPAIEYMLTLIEMAALKGGNGVGNLPGYVFWLIAQESNSGSQVVSDLLKKVPNINKVGEVDTVRDSKFRRVFIVNRMTDETKAFFITDFIKSVAVQKASIAKEALNDESINSETADSKIVANVLQNAQSEKILQNASTQSEQVLQNVSTQSGQVGKNVNALDTNDNAETTVNIDEQLLTIGIIEAITKGNTEEAVDMVLKEVRKEYNLEDAVAAVVSALNKSGDLYNLDQLARALPASHPAVDSVYTVMINVRLNGVMQRWEAGKQKDAWDNLVGLYSAIVHDRSSGRVLLVTGDSVADRCRRYGKIFIEETVGRKQEELLKHIRAGVLDIHEKHGDTGMMASYWEACFFSSSQ